MTPVSIRTVADIRRALAVPGILVFTDRNDIAAPVIVRDPEAMARWMTPRTVQAVRSADVILLRDDGQKITMTLPKTKALDADGSNRFAIRYEARDDRPARTITYRLEMPGTPGAAVASRPHENHPPLDEEARARSAGAPNKTRPSRRDVRRTAPRSRG